MSKKRTSHEFIVHYRKLIAGIIIIIKATFLNCTGIVQFNVKYSLLTPKKRAEGDLSEFHNLKLPSHATAILCDKIYIFCAHKIARLNFNAFFSPIPSITLHEKYRFFLCEKKAKN